MRQVVPLLVCTFLLGGCVAVGAERPKGDETTLEELSVGDSTRSGSCSTSIVRGLVEQLVAETNCLRPGVYQRIDDIPGVSLSSGAAAAPYLHREAASALRTAVSGRSIRINSGLRTLPQQYLLRQWKLRGRCGIRAAASPGRSNHESGLAIDVSSNSSWRTRLRNQGFRWFGSGDPPHFDFNGGEDLRSLSVRAFQRLWNRNHPEDRISEDGVYGPATESRLRRTPGEGFPIGARCGDDPSTPPMGTDAGMPPMTDAGPGSTPPPPPPTPSNPCDMGHGTSCASCNAIATQCGWCGATGQCVPGNGAGPTSGSCASGWEWVAPSSCSMPTPTDPEPPPPPPEPDPPEPMCSPMRASCSPGECCSGLECRRGVSFGVRCCGGAGASCSSGGDCCGYMDCISGTCHSRPAGRRCLDNRDCSSGNCGSGRCR